MLGWFLDLLWRQDVYAEMLVLNASTPDDAVARAASICGMRTAEIIGQNQLRLLRHEDVVRQLCLNPKLRPGADRRGVRLLRPLRAAPADVPQMRAARVRIFGPEAAEAPPGSGPDRRRGDRGVRRARRRERPPLEEGKRLTLAQRIMKMSIAEKIKLATKGNKEARSILIRDSNKLVAVAVIRSPRITDGEVLALANNRAGKTTCCASSATTASGEGVPGEAGAGEEPEGAAAVAMRFLSPLRETEVKDLARNKNVPSGVQVLARKMLDKKNAPKKEDK